MPRRGLGLVIAFAFAIVGSVRPVRADCARDADELRQHLEHEAPRVRTWNLAWAIGFGVAAGGQLALAMTHARPFGTFDEDYRETLYVGAAKAAIGSAARIVLPLSISVPPLDADRCVELIALRASLTRIARQERQTFWLTHLGGLALNLAGALLLWDRRSFAVGAASFLISLPVSPFSAYTLPRGSWHRWRDDSPTWTVGVARGVDGWTVSARGAF